MNNTYLTCKELSDVLKINTQVIRKWARESKIPCIKLGVGDRISYRFDKDEVVRFFKEKVATSFTE